MSSTTFGKRFLAYFAEKNITSVSMQREILQEAMGSNQTFYRK